MAIIIDGYNLLHASGILGRGIGPGGLERSRLALLNFLAASLPPADVARTTVVFDARDAPHGLASSERHKELLVRYASKYPDADSLIEELIAADSAPRRLLVVSSDHRLQRAARRRRAKAIDSDAWFSQVLRERQRARDGAGEPLKPEGPLSAEQTRYWLEQFDEEQAAESRASDQDLADMESPFPPGYADDLLDEDRENR